MRFKNSPYIFLLLIFSPIFFCIISAQEDTKIQEFTGIFTIYQKRKSLQASVTAIKKDNIISIVIIDELGVPLVLAKDSATNYKLIRYFPPLSKEDASLAGLAISKAISNLNNNEKYLTKLVHYDIFYSLKFKKDTFILLNKRNRVIMKFVLLPI